MIVLSYDRFTQVIDELVNDVSKCTSLRVVAEETPKQQWNKRSGMMIHPRRIFRIASSLTASVYDSPGYAEYQPTLGAMVVVYVRHLPSGHVKPTFRCGRVLDESQPIRARYYWKEILGTTESNYCEARHFLINAFRHITSTQPERD